MGNRHFDGRINRLIPCTGMNNDTSSSDDSSFRPESSLSSRSRSDAESNAEPGNVKFASFIRNFLLHETMHSLTYYLVKITCKTILKTFSGKLRLFYCYSCIIYASYKVS